MVKDNLQQTTMKDDFRFVVENDAQQLVTIKNKGNISLKLLDITGATSNFGFFGVTIVDHIMKELRFCNHLLLLGQKKI